MTATSVSGPERTAPRARNPIAPGFAFPIIDRVVGARPTRVLGIDTLTPTVHRLRIERPDGYRFRAGQHALVAINMDAHAVQRRVELPGGGHWKVVFNSDARRYSQLFGDHATPGLDVEGGSSLLDLGPYSAVVYVPL